MELRDKFSELGKIHETVVHMLIEAADQAGEATAVVCEGRELTYHEYLRCVGGFAQELIGQGAQGERVAIVCGNSLDIAVAMFAVHAAGAQAVPINPIYTTRELSHILKDSEPIAVIFDTEIAELVEPLAEELGINYSVKIGPGGRLLDAWKNDENVVMPSDLPTGDDLATLQYTGGTTGLAGDAVA